MNLKKINVSLIQSVKGTRSVHKSNNNALCIFGQITKSNAILLHVKLRPLILDW